GPEAGAHLVGDAARLHFRAARQREVPPAPSGGADRGDHRRGGLPAPPRHSGRRLPDRDRRQDRVRLRDAARVQSRAVDRRRERGARGRGTDGVPRRRGGHRLMATKLEATFHPSGRAANLVETKDSVQIVFSSPPDAATDVKVELLEVTDAKQPLTLATFRGSIQGSRFVLDTGTASTPNP